MKFQEWIPLIKIQNLSSLAGATLISPPGLCSPIATGLPVGELHVTWEDNTAQALESSRPPVFSRAAITHLSTPLNGTQSSRQFTHLYGGLWVPQF